MAGEVVAWIDRTHAGDLLWVRDTLRAYHAVLADQLITINFDSSKGLYQLMVSRGGKPAGPRQSGRKPSELADLWTAIEAARAKAHAGDWTTADAHLRTFTEPVIEPRLALDLEQGKLVERARFGDYHVALLETAGIAHTIRYSFRLIARPAADAPPSLVISHEIGLAKGIYVVHVGIELGRTAGDAPIWVPYDSFRARARELLAAELLDSVRP